MSTFWLVVALMAGPTPSVATPDGGTVIPFRTEAEPRVDPVFGDATSFRANVDRFIALHEEMLKVRDEFSAALHATLAEIGALSTMSGARRTTVRAQRGCSEQALGHYMRALTLGGHYLKLGRQADGLYRTILKQDALGDSFGLTPDYRLKIRKAQTLYRELLRDYREMRVAFHDQLGTEMRHAGCKPGARDPALVAGKDASKGASTEGSRTPNPLDPAAWNLVTNGAESEEDPPERVRPGDSPKSRTGQTDESDTEAASPLAPMVWIEIDNSHCTDLTRVTVDGFAAGEVEAGKRGFVRVRSGPHEMCVLPASDTRPCGMAGTVRRSYFHEGWSLTVRCEK